MANPTLAQRLRSEGRDPFVINRIRQAQKVLQRVKRKSYEFRKLVAGDFGSVNGDRNSVREDGPDNDLRLDNLHNFIVNSFNDDHSNRLLQTIKVLLMQTTYSAPDVEFQDLRYEEAGVNAGWVKSRLSDPPVGCGANADMRLGFLDYLIGGVGYSAQCITDGMPVLRYADSLDVSVDVTTSNPNKARWRSCTYREPLHVWLSLFGTKGFEEELSGNDPSRLDRIVAVEYYYDIDTSKNGSFYAIKRIGNGFADTPIYVGDNQCFFMNAGRRQPFIPYEPLYFLALPSVTQPVGVVEMLLASQMALWKAEDFMAKYFARGAAFFQSPEGNLSEEALKALEEGEVGALIQYKNAPVTRTDGLPKDQNVDSERAYHERQFTAAAGTNPYTLGSPQEGINFSSEVQQISGNSGLTAAFVAKDHAAWWTRSVRKFIAIGAQSDDMPVSIQLGEVALTFDAFNPIKNYLRPLADIVINEDSMRFAPADQKVQDALMDLKVAQGVQNQYPTAVGEAFEKYLRARNEKNIAKWMQPAPQMQPGPGAVPGAAPAMMPNTQ